MEESKALEKVDIMAGAVSVDAIVRQVEMVHDCMRRVMKEGVHYGKIPGTPKPSLWQPGADILNLMFGLCPEFDVISSVRQQGFIAYVVKCSSRHIASGQIRATAIASCNTKEEKYARTIARRECDPWDLDHTIMYMAEKRAKVAATRNATGASDIFTQDLEDQDQTAGAPAPARPGPKRGRRKMTVPEKEAPQSTWTDRPPRSQTMPPAQDILPREPGEEETESSDLGDVFKRKEAR